MASWSYGGCLCSLRRDHQGLCQDLLPGEQNRHVLTSVLREPISPTGHVQVSGWEYTNPKVYQHMLVMGSMAMSAVILGGLQGTKLMTPAKAKAIWAIYVYAPEQALAYLTPQCPHVC